MSNSDADPLVTIVRLFGHEQFSIDDLIAFAVIWHQFQVPRCKAHINSHRSSPSSKDSKSADRSSICETNRVPTASEAPQTGYRSARSDRNQPLISKSARRQESFRTRLVLTNRACNFGFQAVPLLHVVTPLGLELINQCTVFRAATLPLVEPSRLEDFGVIRAKTWNGSGDHVSEVRVLLPFDPTLGNAFNDG